MAKQASAKSTARSSKAKSKPKAKAAAGGGAKAATKATAAKKPASSRKSPAGKGTATAKKASSAKAAGKRTAVKKPAGAQSTKRPEIEAYVVGFGQRLRGYRKQAGLSQLALADAAEVDLAAVSFLERAKRAPNLGTLVRVARAAGVAPAVLVDPAEAKRHGLPKVDDGPLPRGSNAAKPRKSNNKSQAAKTRKERGDAAALKQFGANLRAARIAAGMSQEMLAQEARLDRAAISIIERGGRSANLRTMLKLTTALKLTIAEILDGVA